MAKTDTLIHQQKLYPQQVLDRWLCTACNDTAHRDCEGYGCTCPCRDPKQRKRKPPRDKNGLTKIELRLQRSFAFDSGRALMVKAAALTNQPPAESAETSGHKHSSEDSLDEVLDGSNRKRQLPWEQESEQE